MPITEPSSLGAPLAQGDILKGIQLFSSRRGKAVGEETAVKAGHKLCLVLSRQCVVEHKQALIVAGVVKYAKDVSSDLDFGELEDFLKTMRDGIGSPDYFYLGQLPGLSGRYSARLDSLHTIELPGKPEERQRFVDSCRVARLCPDFVRDLHMRVLGAFGNMGFEDYRWLADDDLKLLVVTGQAEIRHTQDRHRTLTASKEAAGNPLDASQIDKQVKTIAGMQRRLQPYAEELARRHSASPPLVTRDTPDER